jgi:hypothetical protein
MRQATTIWRKRVLRGSEHLKHSIPRDRELGTISFSRRIPRPHTITPEVSFLGFVMASPPPDSVSTLRLQLRDEHCVTALCLLRLSLSLPLCCGGHFCSLFLVLETLLAGALAWSTPVAVGPAGGLAAHFQLSETPSLELTSPLSPPHK